MNIKMATNSQLWTTESKKKYKQSEQEQNHRYGDHWEGHQQGGEGRIEEKVKELRNIIGR